MTPRAALPESSALARAVADALSDRMRQQGMSQWDLAEAVGMSKNYLGKRFRHESPLTLNDLESICRVLRLDPATVVAMAGRDA